MRHLISVIGWKIIGRLGGYLRRGLGDKLSGFGTLEGIN
jgi:hypothetical protein